MTFPTSVPKACFRHLGRKFFSFCPYRLPSRRPVFCNWDGSFSPSVLADFRPEGPFSAFGTEVFLLLSLPTSVPEASFRHLRRKFYSSCPYRLPSLRSVFDDWDGSFSPSVLADFRPEGPFSAFGTEVFLLLSLPTSVPEASFRHLRRKFYAPGLCGLPSLSCILLFFQANLKNSALLVGFSALPVRHIFCISLSLIYEYQSDT